MDRCRCHRALSNAAAAAAAASAAAPPAPTPMQGPPSQPQSAALQPGEDDSLASSSSSSPSHHSLSLVMEVLQRYKGRPGPGAQQAQQALAPSPGPRGTALPAGTGRGGVKEQLDALSVACEAALARTATATSPSIQVLGSWR